MNTESMLKLVIFEAADRGSITSEEKQMMLEFVDTTIMMESFFSDSRDYANKLKENFAKITEIRKMSPNSYDGPKEIKKFIDKFYPFICKCIEFCENYDDNRRKLLAPGMISVAVVLIAGFVTSGLLILTVSPAIASYAYIVTFLITMILAIIEYCIEYSFDSNNDKTIDELIKIKNMLIKCDTKKLNGNIKSKIGRIINEIESLETGRESKREREKIDIMRQIAYNTATNYNYN